MAERRLSPHEELLWESVAADIEPLNASKRARNIPNEKPARETIRPAKRTPKRKPASELQHPQSSQQPTAPKPLHADIDKRTFARLKKGKMVIEARLDLHGYTQDSAHRALAAFIEAAHGAGRRCVLVITGKGLRGPEENRGILKRKVPQWLSSGRLAPMIVSWQPAQPRDGGDGALYILIRRRR